MPVKTEAYTVKLDPAVKEEWQEMLTQVMRDRGLSTIGEAYPAIMEAVRGQERAPSPDISGHVAAIRINLDSVMSDVMAIDGIYKSAVENGKVALEEAKGTLAAQLEESLDRIRALEKELEKTRERLRDSEEMAAALKSENETLKADREERKEILRLLGELKGRGEAEAGRK